MSEVLKFGRWEVIGECVNPKFWLCRCGDGCPFKTERRVNKANLRAGLTKSCGCWSQDRKTTHGMSRTRTYQIWRSIFDRLKHNLRYVNKGITICERWKKFENFYADMGEAPPKLSIDRGEDNDKGYWCGKPECPECGPLGRTPNCAWATSRVQQRHKTDNRKLTYNGETKLVIEWAEQYGLKMSTLSARLDRGWDAHQALNRPEMIRRGRNAPQTENRLIEYKGKTLTVEEWSVEFGLRLEVMIDRLHHGWSMERIEYTPPRKKRKDCKRVLATKNQETEDT